GYRTPSPTIAKWPPPPTSPSSSFNWDANDVKAKMEAFSKFGAAHRHRDDRQELRQVAQGTRE
ncbi:hypothetical protein PENTCL1PPCAC_30562, partial [Pristionchus entomophagus]